MSHLVPSTHLTQGVEEIAASILYFNHEDEEACPSEMSVSIYKSTWCHNPKAHNLVSQDSWHTSQGSDWAPPKYKPGALLFILAYSVVCLWTFTVVFLI